MIIVAASAKTSHHRDTENTDKTFDLLGAVGASLVDFV